jgi:hypothetical protein
VQVVTRASSYHQHARSDRCVENTNRSSSESAFLVTTPDDPSVHPWIQA